MTLRQTQQSDEQGAALITALLIVSVMSVVALGVIENIRFSVRATTNLVQREQARLYAIGVEQFAISALEKSIKSRVRYDAADDDRRPELDAWVQQPIQFPIDGGRILGRVKDGSNCFNLNSLVSSAEGGTYVSDITKIEKFATLLEQVDVPPSDARSLAGATADWIDTDSTPNFGGAEDDEYSRTSLPYRTGQTLLADVSELRVIKGFDAELVEVLENVVCVRPDTELAKLNINTFTEQDMPWVLTLLGSDYDQAAIESILAARPTSGFDNLKEFFRLSIFNDREFDDSYKNQFGLRSQYYEVGAEISYYETVLNVNSVLKILGTGDVKVLSRRFGSF